MATLHIVQGGIDNGDKKWLEKAARNNLSSRSWIVPKSASIGDDVVIYVSGYGFFATARIKTRSKPRTDWRNRYGAGLHFIKLIQPAISIGSIRRHIPKLTWARYPRSITTPPADTASQIRKLISERRKTGIPDLDDVALASANIDELRKVALLSARPSATKKERTLIFRTRSKAIHLYVLSRANGHCEGCKAAAPFRKADGRPYIEPHHTKRLADDGPDHPASVIGLCPNCHRRAHFSEDAKTFNRSLERKLVRLEAGRKVPDSGRRHLKEWWDDVLKMSFDDPEQEAANWTNTNNIALATPYPGIQIKAWAMTSSSQMGVYLTGTRTKNVDAIAALIKRDKRYLLDNLPKGTVVDPRHGWPIICEETRTMSDVERRAWLVKTLNIFANVLRPRLRSWYHQTQGRG